MPADPNQIVLNVRRVTPDTPSCRSEVRVSVSVGAARDRVDRRYSKGRDRSVSRIIQHPSCVLTPHARLSRIDRADNHAHAGVPSVAGVSSSSRMWRMVRSTHRQPPSCDGDEVRARPMRKRRRMLRERRKDRQQPKARSRQMRMRRMVRARVRTREQQRRVQMQMRMVRRWWQRMVQQCASRWRMARSMVRVHPS